MNELFNLVEKLRERIKKYGDDLSRNEALTRYVLIDPLLRALGWDTENPDIVRPEERQEKGRPDYVLLHNGKKLIALEAKSLNTKLDEKDVLNLGFNYSWSSGIPYFIITDGNIWKIYDVSKLGGKIILEINIFNEPIEEVIRKLLSLWKPIIKEKIEEVKTTIEPPPSPKVGSDELDLNKVREFYNSLTNKEKEFIKIVFEAWKQGRVLTKEDIINELMNRGIKVDKLGFTGIKSGITRLSKKLGLPPPMPTGKLGEEYWKSEIKRYVLNEKWGKALEKILGVG